MWWSKQAQPATLSFSPAFSSTGTIDSSVEAPASFTGEKPLDVEELRTRLRKMTDAQLIAFGKSAAFVCHDNSPREVFIVQLEESRNEWRRRKTLRLGLNAVGE